MKTETHVLFTDKMDNSNVAEFSVEDIKNLSFIVSDCGNFKGTEEECNNEGNKLLTQFKEAIFTNYVEPHYQNAKYESIYDY